MRMGPVLFFASSFVFTACARSQMPPSSAAESVTAASTTGTETAPSARAVQPTREEVHRAVIAAVACWFGGLWSDAEAAPAKDRAETAKLRCHELVRRLYERDDSDRVERLRSLDPSAVSELNEKLVALAKHDEVDARRQDLLVKLVNGSAAAARETMDARRASDKVKRDIVGEQPESKRAGDEAAAMTPLAKSQALESLLKLEAGDLTHDARAIGVLYALDRMNVARGLPKRLKVASLQGPFLLLFGVAAPDADVTRPLKGGVWLGYLTSVANAAGHPVPEQVSSLPQRERMAWGGALMGLADKLQLEAVQLSDETELKRVTLAVVRRVQAAYQASKDATLKTPNDDSFTEDEGWP